MRALVADDSATVRRVLENHLRRWGFEVILAKDGNEAWEQLQQDDPPSIAILDFVMPGMDGLEVCRRVRQRPRGSYIYIIVLTARGAKDDILAGFEAGADDYIKKPFDVDELCYRIKSGQRIIELEQQVSHLARTDFLTNLMNRRSFFERLDAEITRCRRNKTSIAVIIADIDYFKKINDTYGHRVGDLILQDFASSLAALCRPYDFIGRYGGEEFIVCLPETNDEQAMDVADRMRAATETRRVHVPSGDTVSITSCFGIAAAHCGDSVKMDLDNLITRADKALYRAKAAGRNRVCIAQ